ncbi:hypothetical protein [Nocardia nova]|uniref:hypothetical protein n=1 Tax=Nocardia nova TaxID=37330 RepID=UPI0033DCFC30
MSDNELDQIAQDFKGAFRQAVDAGHAYIRYLRSKGRHPSTGVRKLSRAERREMAERIRTQVGEERIAAAWFSKRVDDYQAEAQRINYLRAQQLQGSPEWVQTTANGRERLAAMRYSIESTLHDRPALRIEHRGQVVQALDMVDRDPDEQVGPVFKQLNADTARSAREAAVVSERWVFDHHAHVDRLRERQDAKQYRSDAPVVERLTSQQFNAVQRIRHAQAKVRDAEAEGRSTFFQRSRARRATASAALVLGERRAAWEADNAETNSRAVVTFSAAQDGRDSGEFITYHRDEAAAAVFAHSEVMNNNWKPGAQVKVRAREAGQQTPFYAVDGSPAHVGRDIALWTSETRDGFGHTQQATREQLARTTDGHKELTVQHERVVAERDQLHDYVDSLRSRLDLSIGYNGRLDEQNSRLTRQLTALTAERDRLRGERDEAVQKLAERTPAAERYGSPERQAAQAKAAAQTATGRTDSGGRSALAEYRSGHALADALTHDTAEREEIQR